MITIDGKEAEIISGETILEAASRLGIRIPTLCYHPCLPSQSSCRLCLVEIEGSRGLSASCSYPMRDGMTISTTSERVQQARRMVLELTLYNHDLNCVVCDRNGTCELQQIAYDLGVNASRFGFEKRNDLHDESSPAIQWDMDNCVLCGRCIAACNDLMVNEVLGFTHRGSETRVSTAFETPLKESDCVICGACVAACPVSAITDKNSRGKGRAFEMKVTQVVCPYCGVGCTLEMNTRDSQLIRVTTRNPGTVNNIMTCVKGKFGLDFVTHPDRLTSPLIKENGKFRKASWDEAYDLISERFLDIKNKFGPDALAGFSSSKCSNEENFLMQKFVRCVFGTNNIDNCARLCHASTVAGLKRAFGSGAMTNSIGDIEKTDVFLITGSNTTETHPVIGSMIKRAVKYGGAKLIVIDPREIEMTKYADIWLRPKNGTDVAWINGVMHIIMKDNLVDQEFIQSRCEDFETLQPIIEKYTPEYVESITGIPAEDLQRAARLYGEAEKAAIYYSMGITQHVTGTDNVLSIANLAMLTGNVGFEGTGVNPLRGQNNVQGACDVGALPNTLPGYQSPEDDGIRSEFETYWKIDLPAKNGLGIVEILHAALQKKIRGIYIMGENPVISDPDSTHVIEALKELDFLVVQDIFLTETAQLADVVLPGASFAETNGTHTNTERRVQCTHKALNPPGEAKPDWQILCDISTKMGYPMHYNHPSEIMDELADLTPIYGGIHYDRLGSNGLQWPCLDRNHPGTKVLHEGKFSGGKGKFHSIEYKPPNEETDVEYPYILSTGRMLYHFHTGSMTRRSFTLDQTVPEGYAEIHPDTAHLIGLKQGGKVRVSSRRGSIITNTLVTKRVAPQSVFIPFHFAEAAANVLTNPALDPIAKIPELKVCAVKLEKA